MRRVSQLLIAGLAAIAASELQAECTYPADVVIPDGATSTYEEMRDSQTFVKEYMAEMEAYLECLEQEDITQTAQASDEDERLHAQRRITAIDAMESVAAKFNEQVRTFKEANP